MKKIKITVELTDRHALAYAQFLKRVSFDDYSRRAIDDNDAYLMLYAGDYIRDALAKAGFAPR